VPEICAPDFAVLHKAVFSAVKPGARHLIKGDETPDSTLAQSSSQSEAAVMEVIVPPMPTGIPEDDPTAPINAAGISMLTKQYTEHGFMVPEDLKTWNLGNARKVANYFTAWKADKAAGQNVTRDDLTGVLEAFNAFSGELPGVQTGVENLKPPKVKAEETAPKSEPEPTTPAETPSEPAEVEPDAEQADEAALAVLQEKLGATVVSHGVKDDAKCESCGADIDDKDIANLGVRRFKKSLCVKDYKAAVQAAKR
jgi:hypothetical protein